MCPSLRGAAGAGRWDDANASSLLRRSTARRSILSDDWDFELAAATARAALRRNRSRRRSLLTAATAIDLLLLIWFVAVPGIGEWHRLVGVGSTVAIFVLVAYGSVNQSAANRFLRGESAEWVSPITGDRYRRVFQDGRELFEVRRANGHRAVTEITNAMRAHWREQANDPERLELPGEMI